jgi:hypothetical protein
LFIDIVAYSKLLTDEQSEALQELNRIVRIAVDWLLRSDIGEVIKTIVADEAAFPDYAMPKKSMGAKKQSS